MLDASIFVGFGLALIIIVYALAVKVDLEAGPLEIFLLAGRKLSQSSFMSTLTASNAALANIIFLYAYWGYNYGLAAALWGSVFWMVGLVVFFLAVNRGNFLKLTGASQSALGYNEILAQAFKSKNLLYALSLASGLTFLSLLGLEIGIGAQALWGAISIARDGSANSSSASHFSIIPAYVLGICVAAYCFRGGFPLVVKTDRFQLLLIIGSIISIFVIIDHSPTLAQFGILGLIKKSWSEQPLFEWSWRYAPFVFGSIFSWGVWFIPTMDSWQRTLATSRSGVEGSHVRYAPILLGFLLLMAVTWGSVLIGLAVKQTWVGQIPPRFPVVEFLIATAHEANNSVIIAVSFAVLISGFLCAMASTVDTYMVIVSQSLFGDIPQRMKGKWLSEVDLAEQVQVVRVLEYGAFLVPLLGVSLYWVFTSIAQQDNYTLYMLAGVIPMSMVPVSFYVVFSDRSRRPELGNAFAVGIVLSIAAGAVANFILANKALLTYDPRYFGILYFTPLAVALIASVPPCVWALYARLNGGKYD